MHLFASGSVMVVPCPSRGRCAQALRLHVHLSHPRMQIIMVHGFALNQLSLAGMSTCMLTPHFQ